MNFKVKFCECLRNIRINGGVFFKILKGEWPNFLKIRKISSGCYIPKAILTVQEMESLI